jgi:AcrR family transcriptional regulator
MPPATSARSHRKKSSAPAPHVVHEMMATRTEPRQARSAKSLDLILDAAERLLHERGVVETSTVDVAGAAGVSVGRLYYWFPDKDAVVRALLARAEHRLRALLMEMIVDESASPRAELVDHLLPAVGQFFSRHRGSLAVLQRGAVDDNDPGHALCDAFLDLMATLIESRVPGIPVAERDRAANTVSRIIISMLADYVRADAKDADRCLDEVAYVLSAYLHCRYPAVIAAPKVMVSLE